MSKSTITQSELTVEVNKGCRPITVTIPGPFYSVSDIERKHTGHWFDPQSKRFFRSRYGDAVHFGRFFVSSEQFDHTSKRLYTVRLATDDGDIETVGEFQQYATNAQAVGAIKRLVNNKAGQIE